MLGVPRAPFFFYLPYLSYLPSFFTCLHFLVCLRCPDLVRLLRAFIFYLPSFFMCFAWPHLLTCLQAFIFYLPSFFACLRAIFMYITYILFTCFRFSCISSYFLRTFFFVKCLSFSLTLIFFIFLHALRCLIFALKCQIKEGRGTLIFFYFSRTVEG